MSRSSGRHRTDPGGTGRWLAYAGAALLVLVLLIVGGLALKSALTTKGQGHPVPTPTHAADSQPFNASPAGPALEIKVTGAQCKVFVESQRTNNVLQDDSTAVQAGTDLQYAQDQLPVTVQISDPRCASVYVHGTQRPAGDAKPWSFTVGS